MSIVTAAMPSMTAITTSGQIFYFTADSDGNLHNYKVSQLCASCPPSTSTKASFTFTPSLAPKATTSSESTSTPAPPHQSRDLGLILGLGLGILVILVILGLSIWLIRRRKIKDRQLDIEEQRRAAAAAQNYHSRKASNITSRNLSRKPSTGNIRSPKGNNQVDREKKAQAIAAAIAAATDRPGVGLASPSKHVNANGGSNWDAITLMGSPGSMDQVKFKNGGGSSGQLSPRSKTTSPTISPGYLSMEELSPLKTRKGSSPRRMDAWLEEESPRHTEYHPTRQRDGRGYEASRFHESGRHQDNRNYEGRREIWEQERPPSGQKHPARKLRLEQPYKSPGSPRRRGTFGHMLDRLSIFSRGSRNRQELEGDTYYHPPQELDGVGVPGRF